MLFAGVSLPHRRFSRGQLRSLASESPLKFPTVSIGRGLAQRRSNISSVFSRLKENDAGTADNESQASPAEMKTPLATVEGNAQPVQTAQTKPETWLVSIEGPFPSDFGEHPTRNQTQPDPFAFSARPYVTAPNYRGTDLDARLGSARSASSTYPSEGLSSPDERADSLSSNSGSQRFTSISSIAKYGAWRSWYASSTSVLGACGRELGFGPSLIEELAAVGKNPDPDAFSANIEIKASKDDSTSTSDSGQHDARRNKPSCTSPPPPARLSRTKSKAVSCHGHNVTARNLELASAMQPCEQFEAPSSTAGARPSVTSAGRRWSSNTSLGSLSSHIVAKLSLVRRCSDVDSHKPRSFLGHIRRIKLRRWAKKLYLRAKRRLRQEVVTSADTELPRKRRTESFKPINDRVIGGGVTKRFESRSSWALRERIVKGIMKNNWPPGVHKKQDR